ncbi:leucine-rich repeat domain-containing protein [Spirosoma endophyticum]|nr:hypothetical protein [Spirosoma endophyticum]
MIILSLAALLSFFFESCKNNDPEPNLAPSAFTVTAKMAASGTDVVLTWTKAKDPNGDPVTYAVVYKDTLAKNLTDTTYTIKNVAYSTTVAGTVVASDNQKASTPASFSITSGVNPYVTIPDVNFEKALVAAKIDDVQDGKLLIASAQKVTRLEVASKQIASLQGVETFTNLQYLDIRSNVLTTIDISKATSLSALLGNDNRLTSLDVTKNVALKYLDCSSNMLIALDVSKNTTLNNLTCSVNKIISLDVSQNTALTDLDCQSNSLTTLDISKNAKLGTLFCGTNKLTALDVSKNTALTYLDCSVNQLTALDLKTNALLQGMVSTRNSIQTICVADMSRISSAWRKDATATYQVCK